jgi:hypothetical protein
LALEEHAHGGNTTESWASSAKRTENSCIDKTRRFIGIFTNFFSKYPFFYSCIIKILTELIKTEIVFVFSLRKLMKQHGPAAVSITSGDNSILYLNMEKSKIHELSLLWGAKVIAAKLPVLQGNNKYSLLFSR